MVLLAPGTTKLSMFAEARPSSDLFGHQPWALCNHPLGPQRLDSGRVCPSHRDSGWQKGLMPALGTSTPCRHQPGPELPLKQRCHPWGAQSVAGHGGAGDGGRGPTYTCRPACSYKVSRWNSLWEGRGIRGRQRKGQGRARPNTEEPVGDLRVGLSLGGPGDTIHSSGTSILCTVRPANCKQQRRTPV